MPQLDFRYSKMIRTSSCKLVKIEKFISLWDSGLSIRMIADHYQIGIHEVHELRKRLGLPPRRPQKRYVLYNADLQRITEQYNSGIPVETIAKEMGISYEACLKRIMDMGLSRGKIPRGRCEGSEERDRKFTKLYRAGWSCKSIAGELGLSVGRCYGIRKELDLKPKVGRRKR